MAGGSPGCARVLLFGPPGSGKGTQAALLARALEVPAISTGDMLREAVAEGGTLGRRVEGTLACGELVDDDTMVEVVSARLRQPDARSGFLLDGFPRTRTQAERLDGLLEDQGAALDAVVLLEVPEEELVRRAVARGRSDDREEVVRGRLAVYRRETEPLIGYYERRRLLRPVDGDCPIDEVSGRVMRALGDVCDRAEDRR